MKPELNDELRLRFYCQYIGQKVLWHNIPGRDEFEIVKSVSTSALMAASVKAPVLLRPLSSMTNDEAIEVAKRVGHLVYPVSTGIKLYWKVERSERDGSITVKEKYNTSEVTIDPSDGQILIYEKDEDGQHVSALCEDLWGYQLMLSMGFALQFMGYMVHELEEAGWIKLIEP